MQTDLKELMKQIEHDMYILHAGYKAQQLKEGKPIEKKKQEPVKKSGLEPFLIVNTVAAESPAEKSGIFLLHSFYDK